MLTIGVFFGGKSGEHEVSLVSGTNVSASLDKGKYRVLALGIRKDGSPASAAESRSMLRQNLPEVIPAMAAIRGGSSDRFIEIEAVAEDGAIIPLDLFFPVLHGTFGEDGTIQGLLEMTGKPYVGCGVLSSAVGMDKEIMKKLFQQAGLPQVPFLAFYRDDWFADSPALRERVLREIALPCFVKPARLGSSVGISKVKTAGDLDAAMALAFSYDYKVVVEVGVSAREIECSTMGNGRIRTSLPGEIVPSREFYDYEAKYEDDHSRLILPAELDAPTVEKVRALAVRAFAAVGAEGYARVDFLLDRRDGTLYVNEVNTIPGFTAISMFPKLWSLEGLGVTALLDELIRLALERHRWKAALKTSYAR